MTHLFTICVSGFSCLLDIAILIAAMVDFGATVSAACSLNRHCTSQQQIHVTTVMCSMMHRLFPSTTKYVDMMALTLNFPESNGCCKKFIVKSHFFIPFLQRETLNKCVQIYKHSFYHNLQSCSKTLL